MDEFVFRSSRKLEHLQYQIGIAAGEGTKAIKQLAFHTKNAVMTTLNSPTTIHLQQTVHQFYQHCLLIADKLQCTILYHINPGHIWRSLLKVFGREWSRRDLLFASAGVLVGSIMGIGIGLMFPRKGLICKHIMVVQCSAYDGIESATVSDEGVMTTRIKDNEVLINVKAASVQIIDADICCGYGRTMRWLLSSYQFAKHDLPVTLGRDCTGLVVDVGSKVRRFDIGDEVWTTAPYWSTGTMSEYFVAAEARVALKPTAIGFEAATSLPFAGSAALAALDALGDVRFRRVLVLDCCTPVGCVLVQLLKARHAHVTASCGRRALPVAEALRCDDIIILDGDASSKVHHEVEARRLAQALEKRSCFDAIVKTRSCALDEHILQHFCPGGVVLSTVHPLRAEDTYVFPMSLIFRAYIRSKSFLQVLFGKTVQDYGEVHICNQTLDELKRLVDEGVLKTLVDKVYYPSEIVEALHHINSTESIGNTVITFR